MSVGYRMALRQGRWVVQDLVVDGVSLVDNYRAQFQKFMQRSSYAGLVSEMRARERSEPREHPSRSDERVAWSRAPHFSRGRVVFDICQFADADVATVLVPAVGPRTDQP